MFTEAKFERLRQTGSAHKGLSVNHRLVQNPNQPRLLSTSCFSWHKMSKGYMAAQAPPLPPSQFCRKWAIMSPDPCSPMTDKAPLPTLFSLELLEEKEESLSIRHESSSAIMCKPTKAHAFTASTGMLGPNRTSSLRTIGSFFKRKKKSSPYGPYLPETFQCEEVVRSRTLSPSIQKRLHRTSSHNGSIRSYTTLVAGRCCLASTRPRANFNTDLSRTLGKLSSATIGSLRCSSHNSSRVLFLPKMLSLRAQS